MFKYPSLQREYTVCSSLDPALDLPMPPPLPDDASPEDKAHRDQLLEDRIQRYTVARDGGTWPAITKSGEKPTIFVFRSIHGTLWNWLQGEVERRQLTGNETCELAFRIALREIQNFGAFRLAHELVDGHGLATLESIQPLFDLGRDAGEPQLGRAIVLELGAYVLERASKGVRPLS